VPVLPTILLSRSDTGRVKFKNSSDLASSSCRIDEFKHHRTYRTYQRQNRTIIIFVLFSHLLFDLLVPALNLNNNQIRYKLQTHSMESPTSITSSLSPRRSNPSSSRKPLFMKKTPASSQSTPISLTKSIWPELVGMKARQAKQELQRGQFLVQLIPLDDIDKITDDYRAQRVQIFVDSRGNVPWAPQLG
jgi:hypothetical protein